MAAEMRTDPTARDLLRIAVDYAEQSRGPQPAYKDRAHFAALGNLYANLAQAAAAVEAGEPDVRVVGEEDDPADLTPCGTCGHPEAVHTGTICTRCNRYGGMCERPYVVTCPGPGMCYVASVFEGDATLSGHKHMSDGRVLPVDVDAVRAQLAGPTPLDRKIPTSDQPATVRRLRPVNRGPFVDDHPTQPLPMVRREQAGPFGPPDVDATAEIPRVEVQPLPPVADEDRCKSVQLGRRCVRLTHGEEEGHLYPPLVPAGPDRFA